MPLTPGSRLGPYEIVGSLGAGGMGEVFRARDTRLDREVAVKVLPEGFAESEEPSQRFEREARTISSLSHPHICTLHDVGQADGRHYLVMELVDGESLTERLARGPLPVDQVLRLGAQIAEALDSAHRQGIVHRDLKPGNVMVTRSGVKLLDFGLAKTMEEQDPALGGLTSLPTQQEPLTAQGTILGTFHYMAPEQLEGVDADPRTDIFALGALLYEMATGKRAFEGESKTSLIAAIVSSQPQPLTSVTGQAPPALDHVIRKCLEKDPHDRWQSAHDVAAELRWIGEAGSQAGVPAPITLRRKTRERLAWGLAGVLAVVSAVLGVAQLSRAPERAVTYRATLDPPPGTALLPFDELGLALSPDGRRLAFVAVSGTTSKQIWIRDLSTMTAHPLAETEDAWYPFWSPDGRSLGFFADGKLRVIDLRGGSPRVLADAPTGRGASWSREGVILFAPSIRSPIHRIPAAGGASSPVTRYDPETEVTHRWPVFLPDGDHFLYVARARGSDRREEGKLMLASLESPDATVLIEDASNAAYVEPRYLVFGRSASLWAWRFDPQARTLSGQPVPIVAEKASYWEPKNFVPFAASADGTLVFLPDTARRSSLRWYSRDGRPLEELAPPAYYLDPRISPDGKKIAFVKSDSSQSAGDLWIHDLEYDRTYRVSQQSGIYSQPRWSPDSQRLLYLCQPQGVQDLCLKSLDQGTSGLFYASANWKDLGSWIPDGSVLFADQGPATRMDILRLPPDEGAEPEVLLRTPFAEAGPEISPDGRWFAYTSDETGSEEVYVRAVEGSAEQWQISSVGGWAPRWAREGHELFFSAPDGGLMAVSIETTPVFRPGAPRRLFELPELPSGDDPVLGDVTADGQRFLLVVPTESRTSIGFDLVVGWPALVGADHR